MMTNRALKQGSNKAASEEHDASINAGESNNDCQLNIRIDKATRDQLALICTNERRSIGSTIEQLCAAYIDQYKTGIIMHADGSQCPLYKITIALADSIGQTMVTNENWKRALMKQPTAQQ